MLVLSWYVSFIILNSLSYFSRLISTSDSDNLSSNLLKDLISESLIPLNFPFQFFLIDESSARLLIIALLIKAIFSNAISFFFRNSIFFGIVLANTPIDNKMNNGNNKIMYRLISIHSSISKPSLRIAFSE